MATTPDDSVIITESLDGKSFTVAENPDFVDYTTSPVSYTADPMTKGEVVGLSLFGAAVVAAVGAIGWFGYKSEKKSNEEYAARQAEMKRKREERQAWFDDQRINGFVVIETADGEYMSIPADAYAKAEIRKKAL